MGRFSEVQNLVNSLEGDFDKFYEKGNQAAGTRVRKTMQELKNIAQVIRKEVQDKKNAQFLLIRFIKGRTIQPETPRMSKTSEFFNDLKIDIISYKIL